MGAQMSHCLASGDSLASCNCSIWVLHFKVQTIGTVLKLFSNGSNDDAVLSYPPCYLLSTISSSDFNKQQLLLQGLSGSPSEAGCKVGGGFKDARRPAD